MSIPLFPLLAAVIFAHVLQASNVAAAETIKLKFIPGEKGEFIFDTGLLRGKLRAGGKSTGLSSVVHAPTGMRIDASMGLFSHYRLFTSNHRYGTAAWDFPSRAELMPDGSVEARWASADDRPFELFAVYRWAAPNVLDLETRVEAKANLPKFESFLASYFSAAFTNSSVCVGSPNDTRFLPAEKESGTWLAFPAEDAAVSIIRDGRWTLEPHPVDWVIMPRLGGNLAFRRCQANGLTGILMSPPNDAFAILTPFQTEPHYSTYLSLFGRDLAAGETARARARLVVAVNPSESEMLKTYRDYLTR